MEHTLNKSKTYDNVYDICCQIADGNGYRTDEYPDKDQDSDLEVMCEETGQYPGNAGDTSGQTNWPRCFHMAAMKFTHERALITQKITLLIFQFSP